MGKESLPLLFGVKPAEVKDVKLWYEALLSGKDTYASCFVASFTRVKNLGSKYMHEYCQFIVEDRSTGDRARIYAERANEAVIDIITLGRDEKVPRGWDELPLPLTSIAFDNQATQPSLIDVAKILYSVSVVGGKYQFYDKNCFWYAYTTFDAVKLAFTGKAKQWSYVNTGGKGGGSFSDAWGLGFPTMFKYWFSSTAKDFEKERKDNMNWLQPGEEREIMDPSAYVSDLGKTLLGDDDAAAYREWTRTLGVEMSQDDLIQVVANMDAKVKQLDQDGEISWTQDFDKAAVELTVQIFEDPDWSRYLAVYKAQPGSANSEANAGIQSTEFSAANALTLFDSERGAIPLNTSASDLDPNVRLTKAMAVLIGAVLAEAGYNSGITS